MIRSKVESSIGFSRIHYLWYSLVLLFPPVHEFGHMLIAVLCGDRVLSFGYWYVLVNHDRLFHYIWEYSPLISLGCVLLWGYLMLRKMDVHLRGLGFYGKKTTI